jgi:hypothetical protein
MSVPRHTPFDGSSKLFQIGLRPLDPADWIDVDERLPAYLDEKDRLWSARPDEVFAAEPETEDAQRELLAMLVELLPTRFPEIYRREGDAVRVGDRMVPLPEGAPLLTAARLVQDDLVLMRRGDRGWRLAAASLCFPSSWSLVEKFGRPIHEVHGPVPGFGGGSRNAELIARMFDNMRPETPMIRWNWSLYGDGRLFHPDSSGPGERRFGDGERAEHVHLRSERQTLRRLPKSGDIVFTIKIAVDPLETLERHSAGPAIAAALIAQLAALTGEQLSYKGMTTERDRVIARLRELALP